MPTGDLVPGSDGRPVINVGPWAREKLAYIAAYCSIFNKGMKDKWGIRTYIDLFSGPGRCVVEGTTDEIDGSPLIALGCEVPFTNYFFNDIETSAVDALKDRVSSLAYSKPAISYFSADCNEVVSDLLAQLPRGSLDFCFIDPTNWQIRLDAIARLTKGRRMDLAITFHTGSMKRIADIRPEELNDFFGDPQWYQQYQSMLASGKRWKGRVLLDIYKQRLHDQLGYTDFQDYLLFKNRKGVPLYHLLFVSKHPRGKDFWDKISQKSPTGQLRLALGQA